jgi:hypothetical protein
LDVSLVCYLFVLDKPKQFSLILGIVKRIVVPPALGVKRCRDLA